MKFVRTEMLDTLKMIEPAIAPRELVGQLVHIWFSGETVTAYNDVIGIEAPFATDFKGGLRGSVLLGILSNSGAANVEVNEGKEGEMLIKAAGAHVNLALLPESDLPFAFPARVDKLTSFDDKFVEALNRVLISVGSDTSVPDQLGVTVIDEGPKLQLLTTDSNTISSMRIAKPKGWVVERVTIPTVFCSELQRICKGGGDLSISDNDIIAKSPSGVRLFSRLVAIERPLKFNETIKKMAPPDMKMLVPIPEMLKRALDRVSVLMDGNTEDVAFFFENNKAGESCVGLFAKTSLGEIDDVIRLKEGTHHDIEQRIDHSLIARAVDRCDKFLLSDRCLTMTGPDDFLYLISVS